MGCLEGRVALITGGALGLGRGIAAALASEGARLALLDRDAVALAATARQLDALPVPADLGDPAAIEAAVSGVVARLGAPAILVNNAAVRTPRARITDLDPADWDTAIAVNLGGAFHTCRAVIPAMAAAGGGVIVNVASQLASVAVPGAAAYCTTKGALLQFTRALALDHAEEGIRVNALSPGAVRTERLSDVFGSAAAAEEALAAKHPLGRIATVEEIADAALFLVSDASRFMTGADLVVDGGYTAQ